MALPSGLRLGPYEITAPIGAGGMGEVYRAHDTRLNRDVAIKTLPASLADDANRMARFQREAQVLAALTHPNIAAVYGLEDEHGVRGLVMELVEGPTLAERIEAGPIPREEALGIARQIAEALEAAHDKGIVHRDLKPANIKLTADNKVKVLDFGLAKALDADPASGNPANSPTLTMEATRAGVILGTAGYMAPEQARGKPVDKRADIWAFGVVLFEMLTGKTTFTGETVSDTLAAVLRADIEWKQLPADTPPKVRRLLQRCLERDPKRRLRDIGDAWIELDAPDEPTAAPPPATAPRQSRNWLPWAAAVAMGGAGIAWGLLHHPAAEPRAAVHWTYSSKDFFGFPSLYRDGTRLVVTSATGNTPALLLRMMDQIEPKPISGADNMFFGDFSPDGQWVAAYWGLNEAKLKKIPVTGGTAITLAEPKTAFGLSWGDDDTIVFSDAKGLMRISSSGGTTQTLTKLDTAKGEISHRRPHFLPGGKALLFTVATASGSQIAVLDLQRGTYHVIVNNGMDARYVPTGHLLYARGGTLFAAPFDLSGLAVTGPEAPVIEGLSISGPSGAFAEYAVADSGLLVYAAGASSGGTTTLGWMDPKGQTEPVSGAELWGTGRLSPDGRHVANEIYSGSPSEGAPGDIWVFELDRRTKLRLTFGGENSWPIWTPDGRRITFEATAGGKSGIYSVLADGSGRPELLLATDSPARPSSWSPDGKWLLYSKPDVGKSRRIWMLPVSGGVAGKPTPLHDTTSFETDAQISPDGRWVAYVSGETGQAEAYVQPFPGPGGRERVSTQGGDSVRWAPSGKEMFYEIRNGAGALMSVEIQTTPQLRVGLPRALSKSPLGSTWDVAPDGKHFLVELISGSEQGGRTMHGISDWFVELRRQVPVKR